MELKKHQPAMTVEKQIENLRSLGLIINNEEFAEKFLNDVSYFRLIKAYSLGLKPKNGKYHDNVTFEQLVELYSFNANFRQIIFPQIERIEINLRCRIANYFSSVYGIFGYENAENFQNKEYYEQIMSSINDELERNKKSPFVKNFENNYENGKLPLYALIELFSFGTLSKFYKNMKNADKKAIAKMYGLGYTYLESWVEHIAFVRNICAHYGRLYNVNLAKTPMLYKQYSEMRISNARVFATLICIKHLVPNDKHWDEFIKNLSELIKKYPDVRLDYMGFPNDWEHILSGEKLVTI